MTIKYSSLLPVFCTKTGKLLTDEERHKKAMWDRVNTGNVVVVPYKNIPDNLKPIIFEKAKSRANELGCTFGSGWVGYDMVFKFSEKEPSMRDFQPVPSKCSNPVIPMHVGHNYEPIKIGEFWGGVVSLPCNFGGDELYTPFSTKSKFHQEPFDDKPFGYEKPRDK